MAEDSAEESLQEQGREIYLAPASNPEAQGRLQDKVVNEFTEEDLDQCLGEEWQNLETRIKRSRIELIHNKKKKKDLEESLEEFKIDDEERKRPSQKEKSRVEGISRQQEQLEESRIVRANSMRRAGEEVNRLISRKERLDAFKEKLPAQFWGVTAKQKEDANISKGDIFLFYEGDTKYRHAAVVDSLDDDSDSSDEIWEAGPELSDEIWGTEGGEYPYFVFFSEIREIDLSSKVIAHYADHDIDWVMGFMRLNDQAQNAILDKYDGYEGFLNKAEKGITDLPDTEPSTDTTPSQPQKTSSAPDIEASEYSPLQNIDQLAGQLEQEGQIVLAGPPGTGKLPGARELAEQWLRQDDEIDIDPQSRILETKVSSDLSSTTFIDGTEEQTDAELLTGPLGHISDLAIAGPDDAKYVLLLEDFHRGDCRDIFGEAWSLLPKSRRGREHSIRLDRSRVEFWIPENMYIIGIVDTSEQPRRKLPSAVSRRFRPIVTSPLYDRLWEAYSEADIETDDGEESDIDPQDLVLALHTLNQILEERLESSGDVQLGHMYLSSSDREIRPYEDERALADVWRYDILPQFRSFMREIDDSESPEEEDLQHRIQEVVNPGDTDWSEVQGIVELLAERSSYDL